LKIKTQNLLILILLSSLPLFSGDRGVENIENSELHLNLQVGQVSSRYVVPVYLRLQAFEDGNITFWESIPQNFSDHVALIESTSLAVFFSSNTLGFNLSKDAVGNLWLAANYSVNAGDYVSILMWISSRAVSEDLSAIGFAPYPKSYPDNVKSFLQSGKKISVEDHTIQALAANFRQTQGNMTQVVQNVVDFVSTQGYDREKSKLLLSGNLNTTDMLDVFKGALEVHVTNSSICTERSWYAAAILRAAGVPTRTVTDVRLKTWIQVWLPSIGWVDAETLCSDSPPRVDMFPKSVSAHVPWMIQNASDAAFPLTWFPRIPMRIANLTFGDATYADLSRYKTVLSQPINAEVFEKDPTKFRFPVAVKPETVYAAVTENTSTLTLSLFKGEQNVSKVLVLGDYSSIIVDDVAVSFRPVLQSDFLVLEDFTVDEVRQFDFRLLIPLLGIPVVLMIVWLLRRSRKRVR
jgi:transglutaminase-like putative cysteine protease